jgi:hypothetical protein
VEIFSNKPSLFQNDMKNLGIALLVLVVAACGGKPAAPAVDAEAVKAELQTVVSADFATAEAFYALVDSAATVAFGDAAITIDSLRTFAPVSFEVAVDSVSVVEADATAFTSATVRVVNGVDTVAVKVAASAVYTKGEAGWSKK